MELHPPVATAAAATEHVWWRPDWRGWGQHRFGWGGYCGRGSVLLRWRLRGMPHAPLDVERFLKRNIFRVEDGTDFRDLATMFFPGKYTHLSLPARMSIEHKGTGTEEVLKVRTIFRLVHCPGGRGALQGPGERDDLIS